MPVPHRTVYRAVLSKNLFVDAVRSGVVSGHRLLYAGLPYAMTQKFIERVQDDDPGITYEPMLDRPVTDNTTSLLVLFPGGIGDVISLKCVLDEFKYQRPDVEIAVVSTVADYCLLPNFTIYDYPVTEVIAHQYDAWVNIAEMDRASVGQELMVTFAEYVGVKEPKGGWHPMIAIDYGLARAMQGYIRDPKRPRIGIHMDSACHFRSIPRPMGAQIMFGLVDRGCDVYILGSQEKPVVFTNQGNVSAPPDHIFDVIPVLGPLEYTLAFMDHLDVLLSCDTGAVHIAGALGIPTLALFGMTDGNVRTSYYPSVQYIQGQRECSPCENIVEDPPCSEKWCEAIAEMNPEYIVQKVMEIYTHGHHDIDSI